MRAHTGTGRRRLGRILSGRRFLCRRSGSAARDARCGDGRAGRPGSSGNNGNLSYADAVMMDGPS
jgi:hypothetical protein